MRNTRPSFAKGKQECAAIGKAAGACKKLPDKEGRASVGYRRIRQRWFALRHGCRGPSRPRFPARKGRLLFPDRPFRRGQDVTSAASVPRAPADQGTYPAVRSGPDRRSARRSSRLSAQDRRRLPGFPPDPASIGLRQCRTAVADHRQERRGARGASARDARLGRARGSSECAPTDLVRRRAAARGDRPGGDQPTRAAGRGRADRQRRRGNGRAAAPPVHRSEPARHDRSSSRPTMSASSPARPGRS